MNPIERLRRSLSTLTKSEAKAAAYILENPSVVLTNGITQLAHLADVSNSAIIRMCQKLGYDGFAEFRFSINRAMLAAEAQIQDGPKDDAPHRLIDVYHRYMTMIPQYVGDEQFEGLAEAIRTARRIEIWGSNRTFQGAMQLSHRLTRLGFFNKPTDDAIVMNDDAAILGEGDVCVVLSMQGRGNAAYGELMDMMRERGVDVHLVTMNERGALPSHAAHVYLLPWVSHDSSINFYEDEIIVYMFVEILLLHISQKLL